MTDTSSIAPARQNWHERFGDVMMGSLAVPAVMLDHGRGAYVWDVDGKEYLDFLAGIAVNSLGHAHPVLVDAISEQAAKLVHVSNYFATPPQVALAERLLRITGAGDSGRVYFCNSGTEANEAAFKLARLNTAHPNSGKARTRILALHNGFHGRTMGSLALTGKPHMREPFEPMIPGVEHIDTTIAALEQSIDDTVAALFLEPIKGEAGVIDLPDGYLAAARELTQRHGALLIIDEIQTGVGRTGEWFGFQNAGILPDAITVAKGMAGGVPIGALVTFGRASDLFTRGQHGSTFGGNPLATAVAGAVLTEIEDAGLLDNARVRGAQLRQALHAIGSPVIAELRGAGLLIGVGLSEPVADELSAAALRHGLIINAPNDSSIRLAPPLTIGDDEVAEFDRRFRAALAELDHKPHDHQQQGA
ncbi:acetylornithine transaminase [Rathayibacter sp. KR2-224]|uniref:acetylornithine transaminase n=1 Tax=Rathayibacter sp. KR2-224 TaxID=3400913 RepID=UPI003C06E89E